MVEERLDKGGMERSRTPFDTFSRETLGAGAEFPKVSNESSFHLNWSVYTMRPALPPDPIKF